MKRSLYIIVWALCLVRISTIVTQAQYCSPATSNVAITPTATVQNTGNYSSGFAAFNFAATPGCTYTFTTCGLSSADTYLRLYNASNGGTLLVSADDQCGLQSTITWVCSTAGTYSILMCNYVCGPLTSATSLNYSVVCAPVENIVPSSGSNSYTLCSGNLYDHGGSAGNYSNSVNGYTVLNPSVGGNVIQLTGNITTEGSFDYVKIYDGVGLGGTLLWSGSGSLSIGTITSSTGSLTVQFYSDGSVVYSGFAFTIACIVPIPANPTSITASVGSMCSNALVSSTLTANGPIGTVYWFTGSCNTVGQFATGNSVVVSPSVTTTYYARNFNGGQWSAGCASITIAVNAAIANPSPVTANPTNICIGSTSNLNAISAGNTINWYTVPAGGVAIGSVASGVNFPVTPGATTTYYAEAVGGAVPGSQTLSFTGGMQSFTVPAGVTSINIQAWGAEGGSANQNSSWDPLFHMGGDGGFASGTLAVTPGQVLNIYVGGAGGSGAVGGFNGGGIGAADPTTTSSGGGASDIRVAPGGLTDRVLVAAGGGGAEWAGGGAQAGQGGGLTGGVNGNGDGGAFSSGGPASQVAGGAAGGDICGGSFGLANPGGFGFGGAAVTGHSGGGGGGYYGGGSGGCDGHGGGGSSYIGGVTAGTTTAGVQQGNGQVIVSWTGSACPSSRVAVTVTVGAAGTATLTSPSTTICNGTQFSLVGAVTATGAWTLTLSNGQTTTGSGNGTWSITVTPTATTTYTITSLVDAASCPGTVSGSTTLTLPIAGAGLGLNNESATCVVNQNGWVHFYHASGRLLASVNSLGQNLGSVSVTSYVDVTNALVPACLNPNPIYSTSVMQRHWVIMPTIQPATPVQVRLPFSNVELLTLTSASTTNANAFDNVLTQADVLLSKYSGPLNVNSNALDNCINTGGNSNTTLHNQIANGLTSSYSAVLNSQFTDFSIPGFSEFWLHGSTVLSPLPVELLTYQANCTEDNSIEVSWSTASENNSSYFLVEKSRDGISWESVQTITAAGNSNVILNYSIKDENALEGVNYYRLSQIDLNGSIKQYSIVSATCSNNIIENSLEVYPNPSENEFSINYSSIEDNLAGNINITDSKGSIVYIRNINIVKGSNVFLIQDFDLAPGLYYIQITNENNASEIVKHVKK